MKKSGRSDSGFWEKLLVKFDILLIITNKLFHKCYQLHSVKLIIKNWNDTKIEYWMTYYNDFFGPSNN